MECVKINSDGRDAIVPIQLSGFGRPYSDLFLTEVSGYELWLAESSNNFDNPLRRAGEELYRTSKPEGWGEIVRDKVKKGAKGTDSRNRLNVIYVAHAGMEGLEKPYDVWVPESGYWVPNGDCERVNGIVVPFVPGTLVPFETVKDESEAARRLEARGIPREFMLYVYRLAGYADEMYVGRNFYPKHASMPGRFIVDLHKVPSNPGRSNVGARLLDGP